MRVFVLKGGADDDLQNEGHRLVGVSHRGLAFDLRTIMTQNVQIVDDPMSIGLRPALSMNRTPKRVPIVMTGLCKAFISSCCLVEVIPAVLAIKGM